ncbi:hypothetical protein FRB91_003484 [Serendipita sp. 411]|nr:hypothetical protein FRC19_011024 [Serendipita sp. 401]KAG8835619.1 hypothetical protein FRC18_000230 [Serendipita sp. 400]KAG8854487.1 hypothetical protein FRB91_003484 [Serendipita sp. 411]KAG9052295.1 hypothetical protein FS842_010173 [Serendipita sp. 407]
MVQATSPGPVARCTGGGLATVDVHNPHLVFAPYNGDVLLQSSDAVLFGVHSCVLALASPVFRDMLSTSSLASPSQSPAGSFFIRKPIALSEPAHILEYLLCLIYPLPPPSFDNLSFLTLVVEASIKYKLSSVTNTLRRHLLSPLFLHRHPLRVFAIARRFDFLGEASEASRASLDVDMFSVPISEELRYISAYDYHGLLTLHYSRSQATRDLLSSRSKDCPLRCVQCSYDDSGGYELPPRWWLVFEKRAKQELRRRPLTDIIFSMQFLSKCANAGCPSCGTSILNSFEFMECLKAEMDALPDAISFV